MKIIGFGGGSGAGKTTLARSLVEKYPTKFEMISLDKYKRVERDTSKLPRSGGFIDWDSPETNDWNKILADIKTLQNGSIVSIDIWTLGNDSLRNPKYEIVKSRTLYPKDILIVEGYLALFREELRRLYTRSYFIQAQDHLRLARRDRVTDVSYDEQIHIPKHNKYVEPTAQYADVVLDSSKIGADKILKLVEEDLERAHLLP